MDFVQKEDFDLLKDVKRQLAKYLRSGKVSARLTINKVITLHNVFADLFIGLLYERVKEDNRYLSTMRALLVVSGHWQDTITVPIHAHGCKVKYPTCECHHFQIINISDIEIDEHFRERLLADLVPVKKVRQWNEKSRPVNK